MGANGDNASNEVVDSVQEIVRKDPANIPEGYVVTSLVADPLLPHLSSDIPVIDLSLLDNGDELRRLDEACAEWGFFQIINHGIPPEVLRRMKDVAAGFFALPLAQKEKYLQRFGQTPEEKLDWNDMFILAAGPEKSRNVDEWPSEPPEFREATENYSNEVQRVAEELLAALSTAMEMERDGLLKVHKEMQQAMRMNYYPTCSDPDKVIGVSPHSDSGTLTILLQDDGVGGLQIRRGSGWVPVKPIPDALVLNVGDALEVLSNGRYQSIEHRAMTNKSKARMSIASFIYPQEDAEIEPLNVNSDSSGQFKPKYKKIVYGEYLADMLRSKLAGKSLTQGLKLDAE